MMSDRTIPRLTLSYLDIGKYLSVFQPLTTIHPVAGSLGIDVGELRPLFFFLALLFCLFLPSDRSIHFRIKRKLL